MNVDESPALSDANAAVRVRVGEQLQSATGMLSTQALARMDRDMPWFAELPAEERSFVGLIVQAGIRAFVDWFKQPGTQVPLRAEVFGKAPQRMAGTISLQQTVALIRVSIEVTEENIATLVSEDDSHELRRAVATYAREVAFTTAEIYARQAEQRGAWDARLEALVVDAIVRPPHDDSAHVEAAESLASRASALGWQGRGNVVVMTGELGNTSTLDHIRHHAREQQIDALVAVQGERLVVVLGGVNGHGRPAPQIAEHFAPGPVVIGPVVDGITEARKSARAAMAGLRAVSGWPAAPRPVAANDLLPERALDGDIEARKELTEHVYGTLAQAGPILLDTLRCYFNTGSSVEATARFLYVHANTVRYRIKRVTALTDYSPLDPRDAYTLRTAMTLGDLTNPL